jgi:hypothetical protein
VLLGATQLRTVDFDRGRVMAMPKARPHADAFVVGLVASSQTYAVTAVCPSSGAGGRLRFLRIGADGSVSVVTLPDGTDVMLADDTYAWGVTLAGFLDNPHASGYLVPLDGGRRVRLPAGFFPDTFLQPRGVIVLVQPGPTGPNTPHSLLLVDATSGGVRAHLGKGWPIAASDGLVLWASGCDTDSDTPCTLHSWSLTGGSTASYQLPRPAIEGSGVISPDRRLIAFTVERPAPDRRFAGQPPLPNDIAVLHLDSGRLEIVPGIELPAMTASPGLAFSAHGRSRMIALDAGQQTRLLAWRSGLVYPYESKPIAGQVMDLGPGPSLPPILVLPARTGR